VRACFAHAIMHPYKIQNPIPMKLYTQARLVAVSKESFKDKDSGEDIVYYVNVMKTVGGDILTANSKKDFSDNEGDEGVVGVEVSIKQAKNEYEFAQLKFALRSFDVDATINVEETVDIA